MIRRWHSTFALVMAVVGVTACGGETKPASDTRDSIRAAPAESLVAATPGGVEIWFTLARDAAHANGSRCTERGIEIRRGSARLKVPLLYTGTAPVLLNDSTIRARLWNRCEPGDAYLVNLRTGRPVKETARGKP